MNSHHYVNGKLYLENISIEKIAAEVQTPFYCYSQSKIISAYQCYEKGLTDINKMICYAVKANSNQAVIKTLADEGAGADVVSEGELRRALQAGVPAEKIVYSGVAKTSSEIQFALSKNIFQFNIESVNELHLVNSLACAVNKVAAVAFRINPNVDAITHAKITTGKSENKFGININQAREIYGLAASLEGILVQGVDVHIGSQLTQLGPFEEAFILIRQLVEDLRSDGHDINVIDVGGGLGVDYGDDQTNDQKQQDQSSSIEAYCSIVKRQFADLNCLLVLEPGRSLVAQSGLLISRVIYKKLGEERTFVIIDAAMNDLIRPSMYDAHHNILAITETDSQASYDIVGPVCETGDTFAKQRTMSELVEGDLVAIASVGAYGAVMSSTYNTRLQIPELLVKDQQYNVIKPRLNYDALINQDQLASWQ